MSSTTKQLIGGIIFLILSVLYGIGASSIELFVVGSAQIFTARTLPFALSIIGAICSLILILSASVVILKKKYVATPRNKPISSKIHWMPLLLFFLLMLAYTFFFNILGFITATIGFIFGGAFILGERKILRTLLISSAIVLGFWLIISLLLDIYLAPGIVWEFLEGLLRQ